MQNVSKSWGATTALADVSLSVPDGSFVVLLGPTGAGKTSTLRMVSGLDTPDRGEVMIGGRPMKGLTPAQRNVAMVFQQYSLYPHLTVRENMEFPLKSPLLRTPRAEIARKVAEVAETRQISHKLDNKATALSGGALPLADSVVVGLSKLSRLLEADYPNRCAVVQPGVTNLAITGAV